MSSDFLSQDEVDTLLKGVQEEGIVTPETMRELGNVRPYDLTSREHLIQTRLPVLEIITQRFAQHFRISLYDFVKVPCEITPNPLRIMKYADFIRGVTVPTNINLLRINPLPGHALFIIDPNLIFLMVDNLFGGQGRFHKSGESRDFTPTEQRIIQRLMIEVIDCQTRSWQMVHPIHFEYVRSESYKQYLNVCSPDDMVVINTVSIKLGETIGELVICFPFTSLEPIREVLSVTTRQERETADRSWAKLIANQVKAAEVKLTADLGTALMTLRHVLNMQVGDFIPIEVPSSIQAKADSTPLIECGFGVSNGQYALRVERIIPLENRES
jgi:flagellar motor switch protein FliM